MLFSRAWLADYVDLPPTAEELALRLTLGGFAVEAIAERDGDAVLDVDVTTNRPDVMCHVGLAREVAALSGGVLRLPPEVAAEPEEDEPAGRLVEVAIEDLGDCPRYVARGVRGVRVGPSPDWLARRLVAIGQRPVNNVVDVTNYVLWELGQPLHAFDLARLAGGAITIRRARCGERLVTLDGVERELDPEVLVIGGGEGPVALAGVMGGQASEVSAATRDVLIESAHFEPGRVRRGSRRLGLRSDASHRFERGTDPLLCRRAADRAVALIARVAGGEEVRGAVDRRRQDADWRLRGTLDASRLAAFTGQPIAAAEVERALAALGFAWRPAGPDCWRLRAPSWRFYDLHPATSGRRADAAAAPEIYEADLFEEVLRLRGFDSVAPRLPSLAGPDAGDSSGYRQRERIRSHLAACGLAEAIAYAFYGPAEDRRFPPCGGEGAAVAVENPLSERLSVLRRSLLPGLVEAALYNLRRGAEAVRLFEVGHLFAAGPAGDEGGGEDRVEVEALGVIVGGVAGEPWDRPQPLDLFHLKGILEGLARCFGVELAWRAAAVAGMVPGTGAEVLLAGDSPEASPVGVVGQVEEHAARVTLFAAQLATAVLGHAPALREVRLPSRFPGVRVDLTLTHSLGVPWAAIAAAVRERREPHLLDFALKDRYQGEGVPAGAVNTTLSFHFNAPDRSLSQEEVNSARDALRDHLAGRFGAPPQPPAGGSSRGGAGGAEDRP